MPPELFYQAGKAKTSKMRPNFTGNAFGFGRKNRENALRTFFQIASELHGKQLRCFETQNSMKRAQNFFINLASYKRRIPKMRLNFLYAVT